MASVSFMKRVRESKVKQPVQQGFSISAWEGAFASIPTPSTEDLRLYEAGLWFHRRLNSIRSRLNTVRPIIIKKDKLVRMYVGTINYTVRTLVNRAAGPIELPFLLPNIEVFGFNMEVVTMMDAIINSARFPLIEAIKNEFSSKGRKTPINELEDYIRIHLEMGFAYDMLENLWAECLWGGWYVDTSDVIDVVRPLDLDEEIKYVTSDYRRQQLLAELSTHVVHMQNQLLPLYRAISPRLYIQGTNKNKDKYQIVVGQRENLQQVPINEFSMRIAAEEIYFDPLLESPLPNLAGLTIRHLLDAWSFLFPLSELSLPNTDKLKRTTWITTILEYSPVFKRADLEHVLVKALDMSRIQSKRVIDILTFSGIAKDDLWLKPFVPVNESEVTLIEGVLSASNPLRLIDYWMKEGNIDLGERGRLFEQFVRDEVKRQNILKNVIVHERPLELSFDNSIGDIDLVVQIGNKILLGEVKCSIYPASPREYYNYRQVLLEAARQVHRKAEAVRHHLKESLSELGTHLIREKEVEVIPVIISNIPLGAGHTFEEIPVVDLRILTRYFGEGSLPRFAVVGAEGIEAVGEVVVFFTSEDEAEENIKDYLASPPQLGVMMPFVHTDLRLLHQANPQDKPAGILYVRIELPKSLPKEKN